MKYDFIIIYLSYTRIVPKFGTMPKYLNLQKR